MTKPSPVPSDLNYALGRAAGMGARAATIPFLAPPLRDEEVRPLQAALDALDDEPLQPGALLIGRVDRPRLQDQADLVAELNLGAVAFIGGLGSGKTTALATAARSFLQVHPDALVVAVDASGGDLHRFLTGDQRWRTSAGPLIRGSMQLDAEDVASVTLLIDRLWRLLQQRRSNDGAGHYPSGPVLLAVDGLGSLLATLARARALLWVDRLASIMIQGRNHSIFLALSAASRTDVGMELRGGVRHVIQLGEAASIGEVEKASTIPGRGYDKYGFEAQVFSPAAARSVAVRSVWSEPFASLPPMIPWTPRPLGGLPDTSLRDVETIELPLGREEIGLGELSVELGWRHMLVVGPPRSGKTGVLELLASQLTSEASTVAILTGQPGRRSISELFRSLSPQQIKELASDRGLLSGDPNSNNLLAEAIFERYLHGVVRIGQRPVLMVDDGHLLKADLEVMRLLNHLIDRQLACLVVAADAGASSQYDWKNLKDQSGQVLFLKPTVTAEINDGSRILADELRPRPLAEFPVGRGVLYDRRKQSVVQTYYQAEVREVVEQGGIRQQSGR